VKVVGGGLKVVGGGLKIVGGGLEAIGGRVEVGRGRAGQETVTVVREVVVKVCGTPKVVTVVVTGHSVR
jgi:hypothetical protein